MLPALASIEQLSERLGVLLDPETADGARGQACLDDASALIRNEASLTWVDEAEDLTTVPDVIEQIALAVAYRAFRNPDGTVATTVGDVSVSYSRENAAGGSVFLTRAEQRAVRKAGGRSGFGEIILESPHPLGWRDPLYVPVAGGGDWFPIGPLPWRDG